MTSEWNYRVDTRKNDMAHGITFHMWERSIQNGRGEAAYKNRKLHLDGLVSLTLANNQWRYGDELIAQVFSKEIGIVRERRADDYNRIQVYLGKADIQTAEMLEDMARVIRFNLLGEQND
jgi:hypothetical protein